MAAPTLIKNRYEVKDVLGRGGMGVVYKAYDRLMRREVALKTLRDAGAGASVDWFERECGVLSSIVHPNIVEIFDMGEFEENGVLKPYFVMPLLPGRTLYDLIYPAGTPLPQERCADIISQACRGLQAAHESGLLHRDIKPRNIFVMRDDAVKLIDFGVVQLLGNQTGAPGALGTLHYMAPEQIQMKPLTARTDIFSLGTVCYEALTGVHPFQRENEAESAGAILGHEPVLSCALNPLVSRPLSQAVAQAMAKDPRKRFESAAAFAEALQRGLRNERPSVTPLPNSQNRLARAQRSFARGDYEFTREILDQLQAEGVDGAEIRQLRLQLDDAVRKRQSEVDLATARRYFENEEHALALRRVAEILQANPSSLGAVSLKNEIEAKMQEISVADSLARAAGHLDNGAFSEARRLMEEALQLQPNNARAQALFEETERLARDWPRQRQEQDALFEAAQSAYFEGQFDASLHHLEQLDDLLRQSKAAGARAAEYQDFYKRVKTDYEALQAMLADARKLLGNGDLDAAYLLSERLREQCPQDPDVRALCKDILARRHEREEDYRRGIDQRIANEPDWTAQLHILTQAVRARPNDDHFQGQRQQVQTNLQQVADVVERAQGYESAARFDDALEEWLCVGDIYPAYPGLREQLDRVKALWEAAREKAKASLGATVAEALRRGDPETAASSLKAAQADFGDEADYLQLKAVVEAAAKIYREASSLLSRVETAEREDHLTDIPMLCRAAADLSRNTEPLRQQTFAGLTATASRLTRRNWRVAQQILREAASLATVPPALYERISQEEREEEVGMALGAERGIGSADLVAFRERVATLIDKYPGDPRLEDRLRLLDVALEDQRKQNRKRSCADELALLEQELGDVKDHLRLWETQIRAKSMAAPFAGDPEVAGLLAAIGEQVTLFEQGAEELARDHIQDCFAICDKVLAQRPRHYLFQLLKDRAAARHRELGEEYLARVERWLASEPDFENRRQILEKAQAEFPFETRYGEELQHLQRERAATESLAAKARDFEKRGQTAEALAQWRQLRNIHPAYPNLEELIGDCEATIDQQQRKVKVQRLLSQGQSQLAAGEFSEGYQTLHEAWGLSQDIEDLLRSAAPDLIAAAGAVLPAHARLAQQMTSLARALDDGLPVSQELTAQIDEIRKAEETSECLLAIQALHENGDLPGALATAEEFLARFPDVKPVEALRGHLWAEIDRDRKLQARASALDQFHQLENRAANMNPPELLNLKQDVYEIASRSPGDEEVNRRASILAAFFTSLAEVRDHLQARRASQAEAACVRALEKFPANPLFKAAHADAAVQRAETAAHSLQEVKQRLAAETDFSKRAAILREALAHDPDDPFLLDESAAVQAKQRELDAEISKARELEGKQLFGEAIKAWEVVRKAYPWYPGVDAEVERLTSARRKEKQEALDRWFRQVENAIQTCDYETASAMIRQAQQQQPDRKLQGLDDKLKDGLKQKEASDIQLAEGQRLLSNGSLIAGGQALARAHELQPADKQRTDSIAALLMAHIRAGMATDFAACEELLSHLKRIAPNQALPPDLSDALAKTRQTAEGRRINLLRVQEQLARLTNQAEGASSLRSLSSVKTKLQDSGLLNTHEVEVQRAAKELLGKINGRLGGFETALVKVSPTLTPSQRLWSSGGIAIGVLLAAIAAVIVFFLAMPHPSGVPVQISVRPDHATIELDGQTCVAPDCKFMLKPGKYTINLRKAGYKDRTVVITVKPGDTTPLNLNASLEPLATPI